MGINLILAIDERGAMGYRNSLLYRIQQDLSNFQRITTENKYGLKNYVLMGKTTFESIGKVLRNRINVIVTRDKKFHIDDKDIIVSNSLDKVINHYLSGNQDKELFIVSGQRIIDQTIQYVDKIYLTLIKDKHEKEADTYFNLSYLDDFDKVYIQNNYSDEYECWYDFITYERKKG